MQSQAQTQAPVILGAQPFQLSGGEIGILVIHGYGGSIGDYRAFGKLLHGHGYTVHGIRLAGHGQDLSSLRQATIQDWQASVHQGIEELRKHCQKIILVGSSFGGVLALDVVEREHVDGVVLVNPALSYKGGGVLQGIILRGLKLFTPYFPKKGLTPEERVQAEQVGSSTAWPIDGIISTATFARNVVMPSLSKVTAPTLLLQSSHDAIVGEKNSAVVMDTIRSEKKELVIIPIGSHRPFRHAEATSFMSDHVHTFIQARFNVLVQHPE